MFKNNNKTKVVEPPAIMDTSAIIDGRVLAVAKTGFIPERLIVAQFVIAELQQLADGSNSFKRERARYGMDVIKELQEMKNVRVIINRDKFPNIEEVDDKLVALSKQEKGFLFTTDYNLGKVAEIEGLKVLNVNELAQSLRPVILPGEVTELKVIQKGSERGQGIAYLDDGTMVVVENGARHVNKKVRVEFSRTLQTVAGKMMFATIVSQQKSAPKPSINTTKKEIPHKSYKKDQKTRDSKPSSPKSSSTNAPKKHYVKKPNTNKYSSKKPSPNPNKQSQGHKKTQKQNNQNAKRPKRFNPEESLLNAISEGEKK